MVEIRIATRGSALARSQSEWVRRRLESLGARVELVVIETTGDRDRRSDVTKLTEMGAFVRSVQQAVLDGDADIAVHSCKDLPVDGFGALGRWYPVREDPWDVLVGATLDRLETGSVVGTGSPRRSAQLLALRPDLGVASIRGNVDTRIAKVGSDYDAIVLAEAGLARLGRVKDIAQRFTLEEMVPAPGQGVLCLEAPPGSMAAELVASLDDPSVRMAAETERMLLAATGAGCRSALGALATVHANGVRLTAFVEDDRGRRRADVSGSEAAEVVVEMRKAIGL